jgi:hypothetical protein
VEIDPIKAKKILAEFLGPQILPVVIDGLWDQIETYAKPDAVVWEECTDEAAVAIMTGQAEMRHDGVWRRMWPKDQMYVACNHTNHQKQGHLNYVEGQVQ